MPKVKFTSALKRFFPKLTESEVQGHTVSQVIDQINKKYPGIINYILDDNGNLREHVNIFLRGEVIGDRNDLTDPVEKGDELIFFQALSGG